MEPNQNDISSSKELPPFDLSECVSSLYSIFGTKNVSASRIISELFHKHPEYASGIAGKIEIENTPTEQGISTWIEQVQSLFDWDKLQSFRMEKNEGFPGKEATGSKWEAK